MFRRAVLYSYGTLSLIPTGLSIASFVAYLQDNKPRSHALGLWAWAGWTALPFSMALFAVVPATFLLDPVDRKPLDYIQRSWAKTTLFPFIHFDPPPPPTTASRVPQGHAVVVSNHQSALDILILLACMENLHFVSKREVFYIPLVGWVMGLIGHVGLNRGDKESGKSALQDCVTKLTSGRVWSVVFFAEGTRRASLPPVVQEFKMGAFKLAQTAQVPICPVTIVGSGQAMPPGRELDFLDCNHPIQVTIHDCLNYSPSTSLEETRNQCWEVISRGLLEK